ncbi:MAG: HEPN domain-containing protein [Pseudomonadota bacterium]
MTKKEISKKWIAQSNEDFSAASALLAKKKNMFALFFCHQAVEKILKALYICYIDEQYPYVHDLGRLIKAVAPEIKKIPAKYFNLCEELNPFYIKSRYPSYRDDMSTKCTDKFTKTLFKKTEGFLKWSKTKLN